jgi:hypothetical protein
MPLIQKTILVCLGLATAGLAGCDTPLVGIDCTEMGCSSTVTFILPTLEPGDYQINLDMNHLSAECTFVIPMEGLDCTSETNLYLDDNGDLYAMMPMVEEAELDDTVSAIIINPFEDSNIPVLDVEAPVDWSDPYYPNGQECDELACFSGTISL